MLLYIWVYYLKIISSPTYEARIVRWSSFAKTWAEHMKFPQSDIVVISSLRKLSLKTSVLEHHQLPDTIFKGRTLHWVSPMILQETVINIGTPRSHSSVLPLAAWKVNQSITKIKQTVPTSNMYISFNHWVKSVQVGSFVWFIFSCIRTEYGDLLRISRSESLWYSHINSFQTSVAFHVETSQ